MVYGTDAQFGRNSEWRKFKDSETHKEYFDQLCKEGKIAEARILFTRYIAIQQHMSQNGANKALLSVFGKVISGFYLKWNFTKLDYSANPSKCSVISEFIQSDLMPVFLFSGLHSVKQICLDLCDFLLNTALLLEQIEPAAFPQNALKFAQTFNRVIESLKKNCETTDQHVRLHNVKNNLIFGNLGRISAHPERVGWSRQSNSVNSPTQHIDQQSDQA